MRTSIVSAFALLAAFAVLSNAAPLQYGLRAGASTNPPQQLRLSFTGIPTEAVRVTIATCLWRRSSLALAGFLSRFPFANPLPLTPYSPLAPYTGVTG